MAKRRPLMAALPMSRRIQTCSSRRRTAAFPTSRFRPGTPLLPGSSTLPGYYGSSHSYEYQGPYYGGPNLSYWYRLPYACGVYGYC